MAKACLLSVSALVLLLACVPRAEAFTSAPLLRPARRAASTAGPRMMDAVTANFLLGGVAGTVGAVCVFPIELAKTKMQSADADKSASLPCTLADIVKERGVKGLWSGCGSTVFGSAPEAALQLSLHNTLISLLMVAFGTAGSEAGIPLGWQCVAGALAGASTLAVTNPMEIVRLRASVNHEETALEALQKVGFGGLFKGYRATWLRDIPFGALYFPLYCNAKILVSQIAASHGEIATGAEEAVFAGLFAGLVSSFLTVPCDTVKTRVQTAPDADYATSPRLVASFADEPPSEIRDTVLAMMAQEGVVAFTKGWTGRVARVAPTMAITLLVYEQLQHAFGVVSEAPLLGPFL